MSSNDSESISLIILPGIGGHPEFHSYIISELSQNEFLTVKSFPHGDFNTNAFTSLSQHVDYWSEIIKEELKNNKYTAILGISFGTTIVQSLPKDILSNLYFIINLSPVTQNPYLKFSISIFNRLNFKFLEISFGKILFWWSLKSSSNKDRLRELRENLYDDIYSVYSRLWNRFLSIRETPNLKDFIKNKNNVPTKVIFGTNERLLIFFFKKQLKKHTNRIEYSVVDGNHSQLINKSENIVKQINLFIQNIYAKNI